jgi:RHS repeat-associated protein
LTGSVRHTLTDTGAPRTASGLSFSPFGVPQSGAAPEPFGFTGELQLGDLVYLRARWYDPSAGVFTARDPWAGCPRTPYSQHPYQYGYSNPIMNVDPTGECVISLYYWEIEQAPGFHHIDVLVNECGPLPDHEGRCTSDPENSITIFEGQPTQEPSGLLGQALECLDFWNDFGNLNALEHSYEDKSNNHGGYASANELALAMTDVTVARQRGDIITIHADDKPCEFYTSRMRRFMDRIRTVHVNYNPLFRNSNGVAYALIESSGLEHPQHHPKRVIGYSSTVYDRIENPWEIPISP